MTKFRAYLLCALMTLFLVIASSCMAEAQEGNAQINCDKFYPDNRADVMLLVRDCYVDKIDPNVLDAAYKNGGLEEVFKLLDPHSRYLDEEATAEEDKFKEEGRSFGGVGLEIGIEGKDIVVRGVIAGSPASRENIKENDVISAVCESKDSCVVINAGDLDLKDKMVKDKFLIDVVNKIRGKIGTTVILKFKRQGPQDEIIVPLTRAVIQVANVTSKIFGEFGYVSLSRFIEWSDVRIFEAVSKMRDIKGLVLDLRGNPGGFLPQANLVSSLFLERKSLIETIVTRKNPKDNPQKFHAFLPGIFQTNFKMPLVVLVNQGSASASEIVAAACQDNKDKKGNPRCVVVGMPTFGKAVMQSRYDFGSGRVYITTGRLYRPNGKSLQGKGVIPDIIVSNSDSETLENELKLREKFSERGLDRYIRGEEEEFTSEEKAKFSLTLKDRQLEMALEILKILNMK